MSDEPKPDPAGLPAIVNNIPMLVAACNPGLAGAVAVASVGLHHLIVNWAQIQDDSRFGFGPGPVDPPPA